MIKNSWLFWLLLLVVIIFLFWLFYGGKSYAFQGISDWNSLLPPGSIPNNPALNVRQEEKKDLFYHVPARDDSNKSQDKTEVQIERRLKSKGISKNPKIIRLPASVASENSCEIDITPKISRKFVLKIGNDQKNRIEGGSNSNPLLDSKHIDICRANNQIEGDSRPLLLRIPRNPGVLAPPQKEVPSRMRSKGETECRNVLIEIFGRDFGTIRPDFLKNPKTKRNLELDCYNDELKLAVEYNGEHHYKWPVGWPKLTYEEFLEQLRRDSLKMDLCDAKGVYLIVVPYNVPINQIREYILKYLPKDLLKYIVK